MVWKDCSGCGKQPGLEGLGRKEGEGREEVTAVVQAGLRQLAGCSELSLHPAQHLSIPPPGGNFSGHYPAISTLCPASYPGDLSVCLTVSSCSLQHSLAQRLACRRLPVKCRH